MKIRSDYVSNSSSSSFIMGNWEVFDFFKITKQVIIDALIDSYGKKNYDAYVEKQKKYEIEYPSEYKSNFVKDCGYGPFYVYDLFDKKDSQIAKKYWASTLEGWLSTNSKWCDKKKGYVAIKGSYDHDNNYEEIIRLVGEVYGFHEDFSNLKYLNKAKCFIRSDKRDEKTGYYGKEVPMPKEVKAFIKHLYTKCGVMDNKDVLSAGCARFFVHFDDNEIWTKDTAVKSKKWESEYYTYDRVCEIMFKYLVKNGLINPKDKTFMEQMKIPEDRLSKWDKEKGYLYKFHNGKELTWEDFVDNSLTWCMHEG